MPTQQSKFLPSSYDPRKPVAVIAGRQLYPRLTIEALRQYGIPVRLVAFAGETSDDLYDSFPQQEKIRLKVGQLGKMLKALRELGAGYVMMVGQISPGRLFRDLHPDFKALRLLSSLKERNATTIFGAICREISELGLEILDARSFLDHQLATPGVMTGGRLKEDPAYIEHGIKMAKAISALEIGQGVVVRKGSVLAVEAFEGTDEMLARANHYRTDRLIFVKTSKPGQDFRYDVPVFGMKTLQVMQEAGIALACLESERTLILDKEKVLQQAREYKIQLYGY